MLDSEGTVNPVSGNIFNRTPEEDGDANHEIYKTTIGMLLYVANGTRPDVSIPVSYLSFFQCPRKVYQKAGKQLQVYSDAAFANNRSDRKSFSGLR